MATLEQFSRRIRDLGRRVEANGPLVARRAALAIDQAVVLATPVDTGVARSNWQASLNGPVARDIPAYSPGEGGSSGGANAQAAIQQAQDTIADFDGEGEIYISNPLPYIGSLNDGSSSQAPSQFVESAVQAGFTAARLSRVLNRDG